MTEIWKKIAGYEDFYEVSDQGRVKRLPRTVIRKAGGQTIVQRLNEKLMTAVLSNDSNQGRYRVTLSKDGTVKAHLIHLLVLKAFVGPCPGPWSQWNGCHNDGNPANNAKSNLRWDTRIGNELDKVSHGTKAEGESNGQAKLTADQVSKIKAKLASGSTQRAIAKEFGVSRSAILHINLGTTWR